MIATATAVRGVFVLDLEQRQDERGFFARTFDMEELARLGLEMGSPQGSISFSPQRGTLRGLHYQRYPHEESKIVRCTRGAAFDVAVDLRKDSPTFKKWFGVELTADNRRSLYVPKGCAHGVLTLTNDAEVLYLIGDPYVPDAATGARWDDPAFGVEWPHAPRVMSDGDRSYPPFDP